MENLKIQSFGDLITNSSSEVFVIASNDPWKEVEKEMESWDIKDDGCSGMGMCLEVYDSHRAYDNGFSNNDEAFLPWLPEGFLGIHLDWAMHKHIDRMFKEYKVVGCLDSDLIYNTSDGTYRKCTSDDRDNGIPEHEQILVAGDGVILKAEKAYYKKLAKEAEERLVKEFGLGSLDEVKKIGKVYSIYMNALMHLDSISINEKDFKQDTASFNKDLHKRYKNKRKNTK